jgi:8-oxo-dGTP diphosphatase
MKESVVPANDILLVAAAVLVNGEGRVLVQRRPAGGSMPGLWEFPGGKVEPGETPESALTRELSEELGIGVRPRDLTTLTFGSAALSDRHLLLLLYRVEAWVGKPEPRHADALQWATLETLVRLDMPPADAPLVEFLRVAPILLA